MTIIIIKGRRRRILTTDCTKQNRSREMYSPIPRNTRNTEHKRFRQKIVVVRCKKIDNNKKKKGAKTEEDRQGVDVKKKKLRMYT